MENRGLMDFINKEERCAKRKAELALQRIEDLREKSENLSCWGFIELGRNESAYYSSLEKLDDLKIIKDMLILTKERGKSGR